MQISIKNWEFSVDVEATEARTTQNASDHCVCAYCKNFYDAMPCTYPGIIDFLATFGVNSNGPSELMPFTPTLILACYRVQGHILRWDSKPLEIDGITIQPEQMEDGSFFLWVGEMQLPWLQTEPMEDVISPANLPEFMERMRSVWLLRHGDEFILS